jgi:hypothetical protein
MLLSTQQLFRIPIVVDIRTNVFWEFSFYPIGREAQL